MTPRGWLLLTVLAGALLATPTQAHFLFVRVGPPAEGGRSAEVYFSELAEAGDPRFVDKIGHTQLWLQSTPGKFEALKVHKAPDRLRAFLPMSGSLMVVGSCPYGVLARPNQTAFLLRHFPKAMAGNPDELNRLQPHKLPLEIAATIEGDRIHFVALRDGKPVPKAEFITIDARLSNEKLTADAEGKATWKPTAGNYSVYTRFTLKEAGTFNDKKYEEIRDFATLAFTWPLERKDADSAAVTLFQEALATRAAWKDFPGFAAQLAGNLDGRPFDGSVTTDAKGTVTVSIKDMGQEEAVEPWVREQLESIVLHRAARSSDATERPKPVLRFAETRDDHPLGRLMIFDGGRFASSYRVKDKQIMVVNRNIGRENMTITVLDNDRNTDGLYLPRSYTVQYWDAGSGELKRTETVQERWQRVGPFDLPSLHTVTTASGTGFSVRSFTLSRHDLGKAK